MRLTELEYQCIASKEWNELNDLLDKKDRIKSLLVIMIPKNILQVIEPSWMSSFADQT